MTLEIEIAPALHQRLNAVAKRLDLSTSEIIADALEHGHSLEWQEHFLAKVADGIAAADAGKFASSDRMEVIRNRYRAG